MKNRYKVIFAGGSDWSAEFLKLLIKEGYVIPLVIAPIDNKKIQKIAGKHSISVVQPIDLKDKKFLDKVKKIKPDVIVTVAYGKIFPQVLLDIPRLGFLNIHPSLLPSLRGPSPIQTAILKGFKKTGVSVMRLDNKMDEGPILVQESILITQKETALDLEKKVISVGKKLLQKVLPLYLEGKIIPKPQKGKPIYSNLITRNDGRVNFKNETAEDIYRKWKAFTPWPGIYCFLNSKRIKLIELLGVHNLQLDSGNFREIKKGDKSYLLIGTKKKSVLVSILQIEGKKQISSKEFLLGYRGKIK